MATPSAPWAQTVLRSIEKGARLSAQLPAGWDPHTIAALALYTDHSEKVAVAQAGGKITVDTPAGRPIMVFRNAVDLPAGIRPAR